MGQSEPQSYWKESGGIEADRVIQTLGLVPHPEEGGFYRETYRASAEYSPDQPFNGVRSTSTAIYYMLTPDTYSALHRLPGDEVFHFYAGDPVEMLMLHADGSSRVVFLGSDIGTTVQQHVVLGNTWQGSRLVAGGAWALLGTTMAPGFDFADYESAVEAALVEAYPERREMIRELTSNGDAS